MGGDAENGPKRWLGCRLGLRYVSFFYSICSYSITNYFFFFFFFLQIQVLPTKTGPETASNEENGPYEDRTGNGWRCRERAQTMARLSFGP